MQDSGSNGEAGGVRGYADGAPPTERSRDESGRTTPGHPSRHRAFRFCRKAIATPVAPTEAAQGEGAKASGLRALPQNAIAASAAPTVGGGRRRRCSRCGRGAIRLRRSKTAASEGMRRWPWVRRRGRAGRCSRRDRGRWRRSRAGSRRVLPGRGDRRGRRAGVCPTR